MTSCQRRPSVSCWGLNTHTHTHSGCRLQQHPQGFTSLQSVEEPKVVPIHRPGSIVLPFFITLWATQSCVMFTIIKTKSKVSITFCHTEDDVRPRNSKHPPTTTLLSPDATLEPHSDQTRCCSCRWVSALMTFKVSTKTSQYQVVSNPAFKYFLYPRLEKMTFSCS